MIKLIFLISLASFRPELPFDSLRVETINGKQFIIHQVDGKETLFSVSRKYGVSITNLLEFNTNADAGLTVGQLLKIPYTPKVKTKGGDIVHKVAAKETLFSISRLYDVSVDDLKAWNSLTDNNLSLGQELVIKKKQAGGVTNIAANSNQLAKSNEMKPLKGVHTVEAKETMYSISRTYGVTVQQLKDWNSLEGNDLKVGQTLYVVQPMYSKATETKQPETKPKEVKESTPVVVKQDPKPVETKPVYEAPKVIAEAKPVEKPDNSIKISEKVAGSDEMKEDGLAELIEGTEGNRKYLALHRTAKTGTIMKIHNELNNREVFVRVVGPLPETGINDNVVIKISKSAFDRLGAIDPKFRVEVTYYK